MLSGRCGECGHDLVVIGHDPRCTTGGIVRQPVVPEEPDHARPAAELTARRRWWFR